MSGIPPLTLRGLGRALLRGGSLGELAPPVPPGWRCEGGGYSTTASKKAGGFEAGSSYSMPTLLPVSKCES